MSVEVNKSIVLHYFLETHNKPYNLDVIDETCSRDYGKGLKEWLRMEREAFPDKHFTVDEVLGEGDKVVLRATFRGTHLGEFRTPIGNLQATGQTLNFTALWIYYLKDAKLVGEHLGADWLGLLQQLGAWMRPPSAAGETQALSEANKTIYRRFLMEVWERGDRDVSRDLVAENVVVHDAIEGQPPGPEGQIYAANFFRAGFPDMRWTCESLVAEGNMVVGQWTMRGTHQGPFIGVAPTGKQVLWTGIDILRVEAGKIVEIWHNEDLFGLMVQIGGIKLAA